MCLLLIRSLMSPDVERRPVGQSLPPSLQTLDRLKQLLESREKLQLYYLFSVKCYRPALSRPLLFRLSFEVQQQVSDKRLSISSIAAIIIKKDCSS
jgi:hypothetical protein